MRKLLLIFLVCSGCFGQSLFRALLGQSVAVPPISVTSNVTSSTCRNTGGSTLTCTMNSTPTAGNCMIAAITMYENNGTSTSISQTGVTWTSGSLGIKDNTTNERIEIFAGTVGAGASTSFTVTTGSYYDQLVNMREVSGIPNCTAVDASAVGNLGTSATAVLGSYTTTYANDIVLAVAERIADGCLKITGLPAGFTTLGCVESAGVGYATAFAYKIVSSTGAQGGGSFALQDPFGAWVTLIVALKGN